MHGLNYVFFIIQIKTLTSRTLKDEVDILRETSEKVGKYEGIIETYKKKLDEMGDLKRQIKYLEEKNSEYIHVSIIGRWAFP